jgi:Xaa-Pro aminopeptidase
MPSLETTPKARETVAARHRKRARAMMAASDIDALVVVQPENFRYITGAHPGFASAWRRAGTQIAVIPADGAQDPAAVIADAIESAFRARSGFEDVRTHPMWVDYIDVESLTARDLSTRDLFAEVAKCCGDCGEHKAERPQRPGTYDMENAVRLLHAVLADRKLLGARLGFEFDFLPTSDFKRFHAALPEARLCDSSDIFRQLRLIKEPEEITLLQDASDLTEIGIRHALQGLRAGESGFAMAMRYRAGVMDEAIRRGDVRLESIWNFNNCGAITFGQDPATAILKAGDGVKFDCGCTIAGHTSDIGRTYVFGKGNRHQRAIHESLLDAWETGFRALRPGNPLSAVHAAAQGRMRDLGFPDYNRGHVGHGIGSSIWLEEWPFIAADATVIIRPNMVFSYELPYYVNGIGAFIVEDQVVITETGARSMNGNLPKGYCEVG